MANFHGDEAKKNGREAVRHKLKIGLKTPKLSRKNIKNRRF